MGKGVLELLLGFHCPHSWNDSVDLHKLLQTHAGVYALLAFAFLQSGLRLGTFIEWILAKQKARNKNNFFWAVLIALTPAEIQVSSIDS